MRRDVPVALKHGEFTAESVDVKKEITALTLMARDPWRPWQSGSREPLSRVYFEDRTSAIGHAASSVSSQRGRRSPETNLAFRRPASSLKKGAAGSSRHCPSRQSCRERLRGSVLRSTAQPKQVCWAVEAKAVFVKSRGMNPPWRSRPYRTTAGGVEAIADPRRAPTFGTDFPPVKDLEMSVYGRPSPAKPGPPGGGERHLAQLLVLRVLRHRILRRDHR